MEAVRAGSSDPTALWRAAKGALRYLTGREAEGYVREIRAETCAACPAWTNRPMTGRDDVRLGYCGQPMTETAVTCGCLVTITVGGGAAIAAGKTTRAAEACPSGRWGAVRE